jgi:hypothetical protein
VVSRASNAHILELGMPWTIMPTESGNTTGFKWQWQQVNEAGALIGKSKQQFDYYFDCVTDAKAHGYKPPPMQRLR